MPKRTDIKTILIIGAGPIVIGQACEFDYSGTQACLALRKEGYRVVLVNPNPASIMTDPDVADATYIEPITTDILEKIIIKERPDALLSTMGGQTSLNASIKLENTGILKKYNVELIGATSKVIHKAEDRDEFRKLVKSIGLESPRSTIVSSSFEALKVLDYLPFPLVVRPSFTLAGTGGGIVSNRKQLLETVESGLSASLVNSILIEEYLDGWKEFEMEVVRDKNDNCIIVCSIENVDPMGIHTGDSITVSPALTLTDKEFQTLRDHSFAIMRAVGVDTGGANVQFAVNPKNGKILIIEMNPRVSRSSALASKATGYPIAKIAAKLAVGYTLDELKNDITQITPASFEPTIDYVVTKIPRFAFDKFPGNDNTLSTTMRSVGEAMAIGRNFCESLQKALRSIDCGYDGLQSYSFRSEKEQDILREIARPTPERILQVAEAIRFGIDINKIHEACKIDLWFLREIKRITDCENSLINNRKTINSDSISYAKSLGFSDIIIASLLNMELAKFINYRKKLGVLPRYRQIDTCSAELPSETNYFYSHYPSQISHPLLVKEISKKKRINTKIKKDKILILGSGSNRIGQGIEFDYCCVHASKGLRQAGYETIMINCNPETVSTDFEVSDKLYFEPLNHEEVCNIIDEEKLDGNLKGMICQFGGQSPLNLAKDLEKHGINILGTSLTSINIAEDRNHFQKLLSSLNLQQPQGGIVKNRNDAFILAEKIGYPVMVRPSYVLGGQSMRIVYDAQELGAQIDFALHTSGSNPLLIDKYLQNAIEVDCDIIADENMVWIAGIMEHIEEAGIHSGDSACCLPPHSLSTQIQIKLSNAAIKIAKALKVIGLLNIQFAIQDNNIFIIEANPRASRTIPFIAKAIGIPVALIAARVMAGEKLASFNLPEYSSLLTNHVAVKEAVFPFIRFPNSDIKLGPEMRSTGEVMGIDNEFPMAFAKAQLSAGAVWPLSGAIFISVINDDKIIFVDIAKKLVSLGYKIVATKGTAETIRRHGVNVTVVSKNFEPGRTIVDILLDDEIAMIFNTSSGRTSVSDSKLMRNLAVVKNIPYVTTKNAAEATVVALERLHQKSFVVECIQKYNDNLKGVDQCKE